MDKDSTIRTCPVCGASYVASLRRIKLGRQTTCSRGCSYRLRADRAKHKTRITCGVCGGEVERHPSHVKGKHGSQFCSRACHYAGRSLGLSGRIVTRPYDISESARDAWRAGAVKTVATRRARDNYRHTDATRAKLSETTARAHAERKVGLPSKLEGKVAEQLKSIGARFERQHPFRNLGGRFAFVVDFWFPEFRTALEVNGTYWHADPRVYPVPGNATQRHNVGRYRRKLQSLAEMGVRVVELWESDFKNDPSKAVLEAYARVLGG